MTNNTEEMIEDTEEVKGKRLSESEWQQAVELYELGKGTLDSLAELFGVSRVAINKGLKKRGAQKGVRAWEIAQDLNEKIKSSSSEKAQKIVKMKDDFDKVTSLLLAKTVKELGKIDDMPESTEKKKLMQLALKNSTDIVTKLRNEKYHLYDLYDEKIEEDKIPELAVTEYSQEEIDFIHKKGAISLNPDELISSVNIAMETAEEMPTLENENG